MQAQQIRIGELALTGGLLVPSQALGIVVFAHDGDSARLESGNRLAAGVLESLHLASFVPDLTADFKAADRQQKTDVVLLGQRLELVLDWLSSRGELIGLNVGLFGVSAGAAAALWTAAMNPNRIAAIVASAGRPDLAAPYLARVEAPTLLIVGDADAEVAQLNRSALGLLHCNKRLEVVPGATLTRDEPAVSETVAHLAGTWFLTHLARKHLS